MKILEIKIPSHYVFGFVDVPMDKIEHDDLRLCLELSTGVKLILSCNDEIIVTGDEWIITKYLS